MRPHPRIRKTVKWGGAVVSVLLLVLWVGSGKLLMTWEVTRGSYVWVAWGQLTVAINFRSSPDAEPGIYWNWSRSLLLKWTVEFYRWPGGGEILIPLWVPTLVFWLMTVRAWRPDVLAYFRKRAGACLACSYSRTGLAPGAVCPECGTAAPIATPRG